MIDHYPKFRPINPQLASAQGQQILVLQDPLQLAETVAYMPRELAPILALCDGSRTLNEVRASLMIRVGLSLTTQELERILEQLDEALLLENGRSAAAIKAAVRAYRRAPYRPPSLAGVGYPDEPEETRQMLDAYLGRVPAAAPRPAIRALISPHIDYQRGGLTYARVWSQAAEAVRNAELLILLGTDHSGGDGRITLTRQSYATPYGVLPTDLELVDRLAGLLGREVLFGEEIHHRHEHSIELAAVWLHHMRGGEPCSLLPILTGSFHHFVQGEREPAESWAFNTLVEELKEVMRRRAVVLVAAADLAHIGPVFDGPPVDAVGQAQLKVDDERLIQSICAGDAESFFGMIRAEGDRRNVCGLAPIYLMLQVLEGGRGEMVGYDRCVADTMGTSFVSICGVVLE